MKNIVCSLAVLLLVMPSAARADDDPTTPVPVEETVNIAPASAQTAPPSEGPVSASSAPSTPSESKTLEPTPSPKEPSADIVTPPPIAAASTKKQPSVYDANWGSYGGQGPKYNVHLLDGLPVDSFVDDMSLDPVGLRACRIAPVTGLGHVLELPQFYQVTFSPCISAVGRVYDSTSLSGRKRFGNFVVVSLKLQKTFTARAYQVDVWAMLERLGERSRRFFSSIEPELAGEIGGSNMPVPSSRGAR